METTVYNNLLKLFVDNNQFVDWRNTPFKIGDQVMATNAHVLIIINDEVLPAVEPLTDYDPQNVLSIIPKEYFNIGKIITADLRSMLDNIPLIPKESECEVCEGDGEVEYEFYSGINHYTIDHDCPVCKGDGVIKTKSRETEIDYSKRIVIGQSAFGINYLDLLVRCAEALQAPEICIVYQAGRTSKCVFRIGKVDIMIMPVDIDLKDDAVVGSIILIP